MNEWDLIVCGAGPAGCALAAKVAAGGARVLILEKASSPGEGRDWVGDVAAGTFEHAAVPEPGPDEIFEEPDATFLVTTDRETMVRLLPSPLVPVRNAPYVRRLAAWAVDRGAVLRLETNVTGPQNVGRRVAGVVLEESGGRETVSASVTADCTGMAGVLRRATPPAWQVLISLWSGGGGTWGNCTTRAGGGGRDHPLKRRVRRKLWRPCPGRL